ncbi:phospholipase D-like domain-containing protein [Candidatus Omnitrophota bacterium]
MDRKKLANAVSLFSILLILLSSTIIFNPPYLCAKDDHAVIVSGKNYFNTLRKRFQIAQESIYVAMYIISVPSRKPEAEKTILPDEENPAAILVDELINAKKRGCYIKVILEDGKFSVNYNAYKRLKEAGIDVFLDSPQKVLHTKAIAIDSNISVVGSFNWTRASLYSNIEYATYLESKEEADRLKHYMRNIKLREDVPFLPIDEYGVKLPVSLLTSEEAPNLHYLLTSHSEKAFDLFLFLLKKAQEENSAVLNIDYEELAKGIGYSDNFYFNVYQPMDSLRDRYGFIEHIPHTKSLTILDSLPVTKKELQHVSLANVTIPNKYWEFGLNNTLSFAAKYLYIISLAEAKQSQRDPYWFRSHDGISVKYHIGERTVSKGLEELSRHNIIEIYRSRPKEYGAFSERPSNSYRINPLVSDVEFKRSIDELSKKFSLDRVMQARHLAAQLDEPKDIEKIQTFIDLMKKYGYKRVKEANTKTASKRRETGFRDISQTILYLQQ